MTGVVERSVLLARGHFRTLVAGPEDGPLVLLLHGFPDVPRTWAPVMERLAARGRRCVAPWLRGYAPSTTKGPFDLDTLADDVLAIVERVRDGDAPVVVAGHDWGAAIAYVLAQRAPERITRIVTASVPHPLALLRNVRRSPAQLRRSWYMAFFQLPLAGRALAARDYALVDRLWRDWSPGLVPSGAHVREVKDTLRASGDAPIEMYRAMFRPVGAAAVRIRRASKDGPIRVPCTYLHGADDGCVGPEIATGQDRYFAAGLTTHVLAGAGHFLPLERPDEVAAAVV